MITLLRLINFKAFGDQTLELRPLTVLTGLNGMGKSSVLQALLVLRQSFLQARPSLETLVLNGDLTQLGTGRDVLFEGAATDQIGLELSFTGGESIGRQFVYNRAADTLSGLAGTGDAVFSMNGLFGQDFHYLQAERTGPRTSFPIAENLVRAQHQLGTRGEYTAYFLHVFGDQPVQYDVLWHPQAVGQSLNAQTEAWLSEICPGTRLRLSAYGEMDLVQLAYAFERGRDVSNFYRATNVGFGITYTLPVIVALLSLPQNGLLLVENPEAHLHPKGQAKIGELMARAARAGIQVMLETHSDHVLNGIRLATKEGIIQPKEVALHFFQRPAQESLFSSVEIISPKLNQDGRIDVWPDGFFDEWDKALDRLLED